MVDEILAALAADGSDFAARDPHDPAGQVPVEPRPDAAACCASAAARATLEACLEREFHASLALLDEGDFREGIRAAVIDKDKTPRWSPPRSTRSTPPGSPAGWSRGRHRSLRIAQGRRSGPTRPSSREAPR